MAQNDNNPQLELRDFTDAVTPLIDFLNQKFDKNNPLHISDIKDALGRQCVDLVQEGGGIFGIALAGYTYILEKMNVTFMKMAGTSAGSINTLLLSMVITKEEARILNQVENAKNGNEVERNRYDESKYFETRSEKVLDELRNQPLTNLVDGHPVWKESILDIFSSKAALQGFLSKLNKWKKLVFVTGIVLFLIPIFSIGLGFFRSSGQSAKFLFGIVGVLFLTLVLLLVFWISKVIFFRFLYWHSERLGINPGTEFKHWIDSIAERNNLQTVRELKAKIADETRRYAPYYSPCENNAQGNLSKADSGLPDPKIPQHLSMEQLLELIPNNSISLDFISDQFNKLYQPVDIHFRQGLDERMDEIISAFEQRTCNAITQAIAGPGTFTRELVIVSSDLTNKIKVEFPGMHKMYWGENWEISPSNYVRASMSVPFFFKPFQVVYEQDQKPAINSEWSNYSKVKKVLGDYAMFVDGGVLSNFPINVFNVPTIPLPRKPTIGIRLGYQDQSVSDPVKDLKAFALGMISTMRFFYDRDFLLKNEIYRKTVRSIDTGDVNWLNFRLDNIGKVELFFRGALTATIFLAKQRSSPEDLDKLQKLGETVKSPGPKGGTFSIYGDKPTKFNSEDLDKNLGDVSFNWKEYKKQRIRALFDLPVQKQNLKDQASTFTRLTK
jgi:predicted acylesterase/phospholipase RssA